MTSPDTYIPVIIFTLTISASKSLLHVFSIVCSLNTEGESYACPWFCYNELCNWIANPVVLGRLAHLLLKPNIIGFDFEISMFYLFDPKISVIQDLKELYSLGSNMSFSMRFKEIAFHANKFNIWKRSVLKTCFENLFVLCNLYKGFGDFKFYFSSLKLNKHGRHPVYCKCVSFVAFISTNEKKISLKFNHIWLRYFFFAKQSNC